MKIILASKSPRRKELLELMGIKDFQTMVSDVDETIEKGLPIIEQSKELAYKKAKAIFEKTQGDRIVIGSDTLVVKNEKIFGKPKDKNEAFQMVKELQGDTHEVITSLCVLKEEQGQATKYVDCDIAKVTVNSMTNKEIETWLNTGNAMDKAGAYAIQAQFAVHIQKIDGNYHAIMGLPTSKLYTIIKEYIK